MASAERQPIRGSGAEPPAGSRGRAPGQRVRGRSFPESERFLGIIRRNEGNICPFTQLLKVLKYLPTLLRIKVGLRYTKNTHTM